MIDERLAAASGDRRVALAASPLLAAFNDAGVLEPGDVAGAAAVARRSGVADDVATLGAAVALRAVRYGHAAVRLGDLADVVVVEGGDPDTVAALPWPEPADWIESLEAASFCGPPGSGRPLVLDGGLLYLSRYYDYEQLVFDLIIARAASDAEPIPVELAGHIDELLPPGSASGGLQNRAARVALDGRLAVIAGGPGTGKTYVIARLLQALARTRGTPFPRVAVCAPTGKAAARLGEEITAAAGKETGAAVRERLGSIGASTIHRLLGFHPARSRFRHDASNPLPHDLVIVDEMSMVSLPLAARLLSALRPKAGVVFVGDPNQLESIEAGTVLGDLVGPGPGAPHAPPGPLSGRVVVLERIHRFGGNDGIARFAAAVRQGDADASVELLRSGLPGLRWLPEPDARGLADLTDRILDSRAGVVRAASQPGGEEDALAALERLAVLSAHRRGPGSVAAWRARIEAGLLERFPDLPREGEWYPGRPIMVTKNDATLGLYNGDIGVTALTPSGMRAVFRRDEVTAFARSHLGEHEAVHALTIHKSQGSQFGEVIVSLPGEASRLLTRELLYTAVTRATDGVTVVGDEDVVRQAVGRKVERGSGLAGRLWPGA